MNAPQITPRLTQINTIWQWLVVWTLLTLGWLSRDQFAEIIAQNGDSSLVVYDKDGNAHVFLSDEAAGRRVPFQPSVLGQAQDEGLIDAHECAVLDVALMKPSCCEAPDGLSHFWDLPKRIGDVLVFLKLRPALTSDPGLVFLAHGTALSSDPSRRRSRSGGQTRKRPRAPDVLNISSLPTQDDISARFP